MFMQIQKYTRVFLRVSRGVAAGEPPTAPTKFSFNRSTVSERVVKVRRLNPRHFGYREGSLRYPERGRKRKGTDKDPRELLCDTQRDSRTHLPSATLIDARRIALGNSILYKRHTFLTTFFTVRNLGRHFPGRSDALRPGIVMLGA